MNLYSNDWNFDSSEITKEFINASLVLDVGELLHDSNFSLYEAMSAIEIMEPKMDSGLIYTNIDRKLYDFSTAYEDQIIKLDNLPLEELLIIFDNLISCLVAWLEGHSLAQTIFICLYTHKPECIKDRLLKLVILTFLKTCGLIKELIHKASVYEEEDFQTSTYGFDLADGIDSQILLDMLVGLEDNYKEPLHIGYTNAEKVLLFSKIKFIRLFLDIITSFNKFITNVETSLRFHFAQHKNLENLNQNCFYFLRHINCLLKSLEDTYFSGAFYRNTSSRMSPTKASKNDNELLYYGFEPLANSRILPPSFPREVKLIPPCEAYRYLYSRIVVYVRWMVGKILGIYYNYDHDERLKSKSPETNCDDREFADDLNNNNFATISPDNSKAHMSSNCGNSHFIWCELRMLDQFDRHPIDLLYELEDNPIFRDDFYEASMDYFGTPSLLARSLFQLIYYYALRCKNNFQDWLGPSLVTFDSYSLSHDHMTRYKDYEYKTIEILANHEENLYYSLIKHRGYHIVRRREKISPNIIRMLTTISIETHGSKLIDWTLYSAMIEDLLLGFQMKLYADHELPYVYWYLRNLYSLQCHILSPPDNAFIPSATSKIRDLVLTPCHALNKLCHAYYLCAIALLNDGFIARPEYEFNDQEIRFEKRFRNLNVLTNLHVNHRLEDDLRYAAFSSQSSDFVSTNTRQFGLYEDASRAFDSARHSFDELFLKNRLESSNDPTEICYSPALTQIESDNCRRICRTNSLACKVLNSMLRRNLEIKNQEKAQNLGDAKELLRKCGKKVEFRFESFSCNRNHRKPDNTITNGVVSKEEGIQSSIREMALKTNLLNINDTKNSKYSHKIPRNDENNLIENNIIINHCKTNEYLGTRVFEYFPVLKIYST